MSMKCWYVGSLSIIFALPPPQFMTSFLNCTCGNLLNSLCSQTFVVHIAREVLETNKNDSLSYKKKGQKAKSKNKSVTGKKKREVVESAFWPISIWIKQNNMSFAFNYTYAESIHLEFNFHPGIMYFDGVTANISSTTRCNKKPCILVRGYHSSSI